MLSFRKKIHTVINGHTMLYLIVTIFSIITSPTICQEQPGVQNGKTVGTVSTSLTVKKPDKIRSVDVLELSNADTNKIVELMDMFARLQMKPNKPAYDKSYFTTKSDWELFKEKFDITKRMERLYVEKSRHSVGLLQDNFGFIFSLTLVTSIALLIIIVFVSLLIYFINRRKNDRCRH